MPGTVGMDVSKEALEKNNFPHEKRYFLDVDVFVLAKSGQSPRYRYRNPTGKGILGDTAPRCSGNKGIVWP